MGSIAKVGWWGIAVVLVFGNASCDRNRVSDPSSVVILPASRTVPAEELQYQDSQLGESDDKEQLSEQPAAPSSDDDSPPCPGDNWCPCDTGEVPCPIATTPR